MKKKSDAYGNMEVFNEKPNPAHQGRNIEAKVSGEFLKMFCVDNADGIIGCGWYNTKYCLKSCKFYKKVEQDKKNENN